MLNYEDYGKRKKKRKKIPIEWKYRERPPKGAREIKSGYYIYRVDDEGEEHFIAKSTDASYARTMVENIYLPRSKEGTGFVIRRQPDDIIVVKSMNFEGNTLTTTPLGGLWRLP